MLKVYYEKSIIFMYRIISMKKAVALTELKAMRQFVLDYFSEVPLLKI